MTRSALALGFTGIGALLLFGLFVWPGRYEVVSAGLDLYRVDRLTGAVDEVKGGEWVSAERLRKDSLSLVTPRDVANLENPDANDVRIGCRMALYDREAVVELRVGPLSEASKRNLNKTAFSFVVRLTTKERFPVATYTVAPQTFAADNSPEGPIAVYTERLPMSEAAYRSIEHVTVRIDRTVGTRP